MTHDVVLYNINGSQVDSFEAQLFIFWEKFSLVVSTTGSRLVSVGSFKNIIIYLDQTDYHGGILPESDVFSFIKLDS